MTMPDIGRNARDNPVTHVQVDSLDDGSVMLSLSCEHTIGHTEVRSVDFMLPADRVRELLEQLQPANRQA